MTVPEVVAADPATVATAVAGPSGRSRRAVVAALLGVAAMVFAATRSWVPSLWVDEVASLMSATRPLGTFWREVSHVDAVHAAYYLVLRGWIDLAGSSPFALRLPSALGVGAAVAAVVLIGWRVDAWTAVLAGVACAVLPRLTYDGLDARSYALVAALAAWSSWALLRAVERPGRRRWLLYGGLAALGTVLHVYLLLVVVAHGVALLLGRGSRRQLRGWAWSGGAVLLLASPVLVAGYLERRQIGWIARRGPVTGRSVLVDTYFGTSTVAWLGWVLVALGVVAAWRAHRASDGRLTVPVLAACWGLLPTVALIASSPVMADFTPRYLSMCAPGVALTLACGLTALGRVGRPAGVVGVAALVALALPVWAQQRTPYAMGTDWAQVSAEVGSLASPGDAVVFDGQERDAYRGYPAGFAGLVDPTLRTPYWQTDSWNDATTSVAAAAKERRFVGVDRVWVVERRSTAGSRQDPVAQLETLGYHRVGVHRLRDSQVVELDR